LVLTKFELAELVAARAMLLYEGATPLLPTSTCSRDDMLDVAEREIREGMIKFAVRRKVNGVWVLYLSKNVKIPLT